MSQAVTVVWDTALAAYNFGPGHPLAPIRVELAMRLIEEFGLLDHTHVTVRSPDGPADDEALSRVHTAEFQRAVGLGSHDPSYVDLTYGLGTADVPVFQGMHDAAAAVCGATMTAARSVWSGVAQHAVNLAGGLHHAMPACASGFCVYNDIAVAIEDLLAAGAQRVAYIDVDVHHGDGVQQAFWDDPRVLTMSIHESGRTLFPGTGAPDEIGGRGAQGYAVNVALPAGTGDDAWLRAFDSVVPPLLEAFSPEIIVSQHGCDSHYDDPLAHLTLSVDGQRMSYAQIHRLAHQFSGGRWVAVGGGGYEWVDVVPRAWTHLVAEAVGHPIDPQTPTPEGFRAYVMERLGRPAPGRMTDGRSPWIRSWDSGYNPEDPVDRAILATRTAVFPHHGLSIDGWSM